MPKQFSPVVFGQFLRDFGVKGHIRYYISSNFHKEMEIYCDDFNNSNFQNENSKLEFKNRLKNAVQEGFHLNGWTIIFLATDFYEYIGDDLPSYYVGGCI